MTGRPALLPHQRPALYQADVANLDGWVLLALTEQGRMSFRELRDVLGTKWKLRVKNDLLLPTVRRLIKAGKLGEDGGMNAAGPTRPWTVWVLDTAGEKPEVRA